MGNAVDRIALLNIGLAFFPNLFDNARKIASKNSTHKTCTSGMLKICWVESESDSLHFEVVWSHSLLIDVRDSGNPVLFDNDGLHVDQSKRLKRSDEETMGRATVQVLGREKGETDVKEKISRPLVDGTDAAGLLNRNKTFLKSRHSKRWACQGQHASLYYICSGK
jgi:hypothetical protein